MTYSSKCTAGGSFVNDVCVSSGFLHEHHRHHELAHEDHTVVATAMVTVQKHYMVPPKNSILFSLGSDG